MRFSEDSKEVVLWRIKAFLYGDRTVDFTVTCGIIIGYLIYY